MILVNILILALCTTILAYIMAFAFTALTKKAENYRRKVLYMKFCGFFSIVALLGLSCIVVIFIPTLIYLAIYLFRNI